ncbi:MAG: hypothetical protein HC877_11815 [Thioploca sp.]|nr:hypothetical protein [Thioploca sp.]
MPIEIKELHIRVAVNTSQNGQSPGGPAAVSGAAGIDDTKESLVAECVEQVLRILENKTER